MSPKLIIIMFLQYPCKTRFFNFGFTTLTDMGFILIFFKYGLLLFSYLIVKQVTFLVGARTGAYDVAMDT